VPQFHVHFVILLLEEEKEKKEEESKNVKENEWVCKTC